MKDIVENKITQRIERKLENNTNGFRELTTQIVP